MCAKYSIVRADSKVCSRCENSIIYKNGKVGCKIGADIKNGCEIYGDTKEQMISKVAQVLLREKLEWYREHLYIIPKGKIDEPFVRNLYEHCLDKARKIIEFLGVK